MIKKALINIACFTILAGCGGQLDNQAKSSAKMQEAKQAIAEAPTKESWTDEEKDDFNRLLCEAKGKDPDCDGCKIWGLYSNQVCENGCLQEDPDCASSSNSENNTNNSTNNNEQANSNNGQNNTPTASCVQGVNQCCLGTVCNPLTLTCSSGYTPTFSSCNSDCQPIGVCSPVATTEALVNVKGNGAKGYNISVFTAVPACSDNNTLTQAKIGTEGQAPLDSVADGDVSFNVVGNTNHVLIFWVMNGSQILSYTFGPNYFTAGQSQTITIPSGVLTVSDPSTGSIPVTIQDQGGARGFNIWVDEQKLGQDGVGEAADGKVTVSLKPNQSYVIKAGNTEWCCGGKITIPAGVTSKLIYINSSQCYGGVCPQ